MDAMALTTTQSFAEMIAELVDKEVNRIQTGVLPVAETLQELLKIHKNTEEAQQRILTQLQELRSIVDAKFAEMQDQLNALTNLNKAQW